MKQNTECTRCPLGKDARNVCVWGVGTPMAKLMIVGEAPGPDEDAAGEPFVGRAGRLLNHCLSYLSLPREGIYLTNAVKCRPLDNVLPGKAADRAKIIQACGPYFMEEFNTVKPKVVLALGATALQILTDGRSSGIGDWQGRKVGFFHSAHLFAGFHPAFILRRQSEERKLTAAIQAAAHVAGMVTKWNDDEPLFNYDSYS